MNAMVFVLGAVFAIACVLWELGLEFVLVWLACKFAWIVSLGRWKPDWSALGEAARITIGALTIVVIAVASSVVWWLSK
jgi:hypothetical protein